MLPHLTSCFCVYPCDCLYQCDRVNQCLLFLLHTPHFMHQVVKHSIGQFMLSLHGNEPWNPGSLELRQKFM